MNISKFNHEQFGEIRITDEQGEPWFVAKDICQSLGLEQTARALSALDEDEKGSTIITTLGGDQKVSVINESGLYSLILRSRKPEAKVFKKWVTSEVLPAIRKTGSYSLIEQEIDPAKLLPATLRELASKVEENEALRLENEQMKPDANFGRTLKDAATNYTVTQIAKELGIRSAQKLNAFLKEKKILFYQTNSWKPYSDYADKGYFTYASVTIPKGDSLHTKENLKITARGRAFIHSLFTGEDDKSPRFELVN